MARVGVHQERGEFFDDRGLRFGDEVVDLKGIGILVVEFGEDRLACRKLTPLDQPIAGGADRVCLLYTSPSPRD